MTIAICVKVSDGVVLAADSASTLADETGGVVMVYNNANKIVQLHKGIPISIMFWGVGSIGERSMANVSKDLRNSFTNGSLQLDARNFSMADAAKKTADYFAERYNAAYNDLPRKPPFGCFIAGYSSGSNFAEVYRLLFLDSGEMMGPDLILGQGGYGVQWGGDAEAVQRLVIGFSPGIISTVQRIFTLNEEQMGQVVPTLLNAVKVDFVHGAMPIQDAADLACFLCDVGIKFAPFRPGAETIGGPVEVAAITQHEGFKWIRRKFYYDRSLNPRERRSNNGWTDTKSEFDRGPDAESGSDRS